MLHLTCYIWHVHNTLHVTYRNNRIDQNMTSQNSSCCLIDPQYIPSRDITSCHISSHHISSHLNTPDQISSHRMTSPDTTEHNITRHVHKSQFTGTTTRENQKTTCSTWRVRTRSVVMSRGLLGTRRRLLYRACRHSTAVWNRPTSMVRP